MDPNSRSPLRSRRLSPPHGEGSLADQLFDLAERQHRVGDLQNARALLRHALQVEVGHHAARQLLAEILVEQGAFSDALVELAELHKNAPERQEKGKQIHLLALLGQGRHLDAAGDTEGALVHFEQALALKTETPEALSLQAELRSAQERLRTLVIAKGERAMAEGDHDGAQTLFEKAGAADRVAEAKRLKRQRQLAQALTEAEQHVAEEEWEAAAQRYGWLMEQEPDDPRYREGRERALVEAGLRRRYWEGTTALREGDRQSAVKALAKVVSERPDFKDSVKLLREAIADPATKLSSLPTQEIPAQPKAPEIIDPKEAKDVEPTRPKVPNTSEEDETTEEEDTTPRALLGVVIFCTGLVCGVIASMVVARPQKQAPVPTPVVGQAAPSPEAQASALIVQAINAVTQKRWDQAVDLATQAHGVHGIPEMVREAAQVAKDRAEQEKRAEPAYLKLLTRIGAGAGVDEVLSLYREIPAGSVYRGLAERPYHEAVAQVLKERLQHAETSHRAGRCWEYRYWVADAMILAPADPAVLAMNERRCNETTRRNGGAPASTKPASTPAGTAPAPEPAAAPKPAPADGAELRPVPFD